MKHLHGGAWAPGWAAAWVLSLGLAGCGGGSPGTPVFGGTGETPSPNTPTTPAQPEVLAPSATLAQQCAPTNPLADNTQKTGSLARERQWMRAYLDEAYLWRDQVPAVNADASTFNGSDIYASLGAYFQALKTPQRTATGELRDKFSFTYPTADWQQLASAGVELGYGLQWAQQSRTPPRALRIAYVEVAGPAAQAGLRRGDQLVSVDGISADVADAAGADKLNQALFPAAAGERHDYVFTRAGSELRVSLSAAAVAKQPVLLRQVLAARDGSRVGHLVFNDHVAPAEAQLIEAVQYFKQQGIADLVLDMRYNGGGYLFIASELAYMIAGPERTRNQVFEQLSYNARRASDTNSPDARTPFFNVACLLVGNSCTSSAALPSLNLSRVYVLTQDGTCSASEAVINGLRGVGVEVVQIGGRTCGKPYGFTAKDNCGISYFPIEFVGVNAKGFGDYADGFVPGGSGTAGVPGCAVADDFGHELGDAQEALLGGALQHRLTGQCPASGSLAKPSAARAGEGFSWALPRSPLRNNRIYQPR